MSIFTKFFTFALTISAFGIFIVTSTSDLNLSSFAWLILFFILPCFNLSYEELGLNSPGPSKKTLVEDLMQAYTMIRLQQAEVEILKDIHVNALRLSQINHDAAIAKKDTEIDQIMHGMQAKHVNEMKAKDEELPSLIKAQESKEETMRKFQNAFAKAQEMKQALEEGIRKVRRGH